ncbi:nucleoside kinase [Fusibacter ferrireducens]|uniref:Nucleoside kinase n=1 Tax=Fusibacter ferrireducens TaxID=2785058 RepID=A0ABR9ZZ86_9FIRM|nr:nucleoside kinase [Fusibacter ferrireducens]MBF4695676.1 nucleoside kinase [Fusibacter ferrireducens]
MIKVNVREFGTFELEEGATYESLARKIQTPEKPLIVAVRCGNVLRELTEVIEKSCDVKMVDLETSDGEKIYQRSLSFIMIRAAIESFKGIKVKIEHSLSKGLYCEFEYKRKLTHEDYEVIKSRMQEIISQNEPFVKKKTAIETARNTFEAYKMQSKVDLLKYRESDYINLYQCGELQNYFYGYMVPSTGYIQNFDMVKYDNGMILMHPTKYSPFMAPAFVESPKIADIFSESERWGEIMEMAYVSNLNALIEKEEHPELIQIAEALHEKKIAYIADQISKTGKRVILIAGPSSSGKTTFANRLRIQLKVNGLHPITISTDNYFVDREKTPRDEQGELDFESIDAVDVAQFNKDLMMLLDGEMVDLPVFNFHVGKREVRNKPFSIKEDQPIIIEGIHGLNEQLTSKIFKRDKFKIYVSALTQLNIDEHNRIPTTQTRLLRRIVRDNQFRGHSAKKTIGMWSSVRRGEERNIFPYQEEADAMFNTALPYELAVLKKHAEPLLEEILPSDAEYGEAVLLLKFLSYFKSIDDDTLVPYVSILKEFIGGSCFDV